MVNFFKLKIEQSMILILMNFVSFDVLFVKLINLKNIIK
jgi:hypothetical protein